MGLTNFSLKVELFYTFLCEGELESFLVTKEISLY